MGSGILAVYPNRNLDGVGMMKTVFLAAVFISSFYAMAAPKLRKLDAGEGPQATDAGELPLVYDQRLTTFRGGPNGVLVPYYEMMPVITTTDGGWSAFSIVPSLDGGIQMAGCQLEVKTTRGSICCHTLTCSEAECKFTKCERSQ